MCMILLPCCSMLDLYGALDRIYLLAHSPAQIHFRATNKWCGASGCFWPIGACGIVSLLLHRRQILCPAILQLGFRMAPAVLRRWLRGQRQLCYSMHNECHMSMLAQTQIVDNSHSTFTLHSHLCIYDSTICISTLWWLSSFNHLWQVSHVWVLPSSHRQLSRFPCVLFCCVVAQYSIFMAPLT